MNPRRLRLGMSAGLAPCRKLELKGFQATYPGSKPEVTLRPTGVQYLVETIAREIHSACTGDRKEVTAFTADQYAQPVADLLATIRTKLPPGLSATARKSPCAAGLLPHSASSQTIDRREGESLRSIGLLISESAREPVTGQTLSIAVFGQPGSGKSFAVRSTYSRQRKVRSISCYS
jgi:hypothetical protein